MEAVIEKPNVKAEDVLRHNKKGRPLNISAKKRNRVRDWDGKTSVCKKLKGDKKPPLKGSNPYADRAPRRDYLEADKNKLESAYSFLVNLGLTEAEINRAFGCACNTYIYQKKSEEFETARGTALAKLENKLMVKMLQGALGYDYSEEEIVYDKDIENDTWVESKKKVQRKHQPGNANMFLAFMYNRFPDNWKQSSEVVTRKEGYDSDPKLRARKIIESLGRTILEGDTDKSKAEHTLQDGTAQLPYDSEQTAEEQVRGDVQGETGNNVQGNVLDVPATSGH